MSCIMGQKLHNRIEIWKKLLLDFGKKKQVDKLS